MRAVCAICVVRCIFWTTVFSAVIFSGAMTAGAEEFPYKAYVNGNDVYVRSGPGKNYYPTDKLQRGAEIEVYRHDPGGWYAVRPLENSYSWVAGSKLRPLEDNLAEVVEQDTTAYVGSKFNDVHDVRQVRLEEGELVEIVGEKRFVSPEDGKAETWYKISPPRGEFRWVFGRFIVPQGIAGTTAEKVESEPQPRSPNRWSKAVHSADVAQNNEQESFEEEPVQPIATNIDQEQVTIPVAAYQDGPEEVRNSTVQANFESPADDGMVFSTTRPASRRMSQIDQINGDISLIVSEPPVNWDFQGVRMRAQAAVDNAASALERGRAKELLREIARYEQLKAAYSEIDTIREQTEQQNRWVAASAAAQAAGAAAQPSALRPAAMYTAPHYITQQPMIAQQPMVAQQPFAAADPTAMRQPLFARQPLVARATALFAPRPYAPRPPTTFLTPHPVAAPSMPAPVAAQPIAAAASPTQVAPTQFAPIQVAPTSVVAPVALAPAAPTEVTSHLLTTTAAPDLLTPPATHDTVTLAATTDLSQFDAVGQLRPVLSNRAGAPRFALTDEAGGVLMFITAPATVNLQPHVGKVVGLNGKRGYMPRLKQAHLTVAQAQTLDPSVLVARHTTP